METLCISTLISTHGDTMLHPCFIAGKHFTRKESSDSGISAGNSSRKTSTTSTISAGGILEEPSEETIKEETPFTEPDEDLCEKITQQVINQWPDCYVTYSISLKKGTFSWRTVMTIVSDLMITPPHETLDHCSKLWQRIHYWHRCGSICTCLQSGPVKSVISVLYLDYRYLHYIVKILFKLCNCFYSAAVLRFPFLSSFGYILILLLCYVPSEDSL